jgi:K+-sensing histidine kinase KdpD
VRASTSRLEQLITNLLDMSRIESGTLVARRDRISTISSGLPSTVSGSDGRASTSSSTSVRTPAVSAATHCSSSAS